MTIIAVYILTVACIYALAMFVIIRISKKQKKIVKYEQPKPLTEQQKYRLELGKAMERLMWPSYDKFLYEPSGKKIMGFLDQLSTLKEQQMNEENLRNIEPLGNKVLVEIDAAPEKTESGLFLPGNKHDRFGHNGTVVAAGPDAKGTVKKGDRVLVMKYSGTEMNSRSRLFMMKLDDILAVVEP